MVATCTNDTAHVFVKYVALFCGIFASNLAFGCVFARMDVNKYMLGTPVRRMSTTTLIAGQNVVPAVVFRFCNG